MFLSRKFANTRCTKALRDYFALAESQPTSATLGQTFENYKLFNPLQAFPILIQFYFIHSWISLMSSDQFPEGSFFSLLSILLLNTWS